MVHNRIRGYLAQEDQMMTGVPAGFVLCQIVPMMVAPMTVAMTQQEIYRQARELAERQVSRSRISDRLFSVWN